MSRVLDAVYRTCQTICLVMGVIFTIFGEPTVGALCLIGLLVNSVYLGEC